MKDFVEVLGPEFARDILNSKMQRFNTRLPGKVRGFLEILATLATEYHGRRVYSNDIIAHMVAWFAKHPDVLDAFLAEEFGFGILPEEGAEPVLEFELDEEGVLKRRR